MNHLVEADKGLAEEAEHRSCWLWFRRNEPQWEKDLRATSREW